MLRSYQHKLPYVCRQSGAIIVLGMLHLTGALQNDSFKQPVLVLLLKVSDTD